MQDDDELLEQEDDTEERELGTVEQVEVPFLGEMIMALLGTDGEIYVPVIPFAERLGLATPRSQRKRIKRDEALESGARNMEMETAGGRQKGKCLRLDCFALWLATITPSMCREEIRPVLVRYKLEAAAAIVEHFKTKALVIRARALVPKLGEAIAERPPMPPAGSSAEVWQAWHQAMADLYGIIATHQAKLTEHDQRLDRHDDEIAALADDVTGVKEALIIMGEMVHDVRISPQQENEIHALVSKIHDATGIHQATIFAAFKRQWKIGRYDEVPAAQFDDAIEWLRQWGRARLPKKS